MYYTTAVTITTAATITTALYNRIGYFFLLLLSNFIYPFLCFYNIPRTLLFLSGAKNRTRAVHGEYIHYHNTASYVPCQRIPPFPASYKNRNPIAVRSQYQTRCAYKCRVCLVPCPEHSRIPPYYGRTISTWMADCRWLVHSDSSSGTIFTIFFLAAPSTGMLGRSHAQRVGFIILAQMTRFLPWFLFPGSNWIFSPLVPKLLLGWRSIESIVRLPGLACCRAELFDTSN